MKKLILTLIAMSAAVFVSSGQKPVIGEKSPEIKVKSWLGEAPAGDKRPQFIEFFHSSSKQCVDRIPVIDNIARNYSSQLNVTVLTKEPAEKIEGIIVPGSRKFHTGIDDGRTFDNFAVQFVPYGVLIDSKGKVVWFGNPASLDEETILRALK